MFRGSPIFGVGLGQFTEHAPLTAHNSFVLTAAELGLPGMVLWTAVLYVAFKIPLQALRAGAAGSEPLVAPVGRAWALAILAALTGMTVGMLFLSYAYKEALWAFLGITGALYHAIRRHAPAFRVRLGVADLALVVAVDVALLVGLAVYTRLKIGA
jgi:O-antigen ligase